MCVSIEHFGSFQSDMNVSPCKDNYSINLKFTNSLIAAPRVPIFTTRSIWK